MGAAPRHDEQFITRLRWHEEGAVGELVATYRPRVVQMALRYLRNREDAEEVAQDVLVKVCQKIAAFRGDAALSSWIYRIAFNTVMSRLRSGRAIEIVSPPAGSYLGDEDDRAGRHDAADASELADEHVFRRQLRARFARAMRALPPMYRQPVILRDVRGLSTEQASRALRVKDETFKSRLHRGRLMLRRHLADFA